MPKTAREGMTPKRGGLPQAVEDALNNPLLALYYPETVKMLRAVIQAALDKIGCDCENEDCRCTCHKECGL